RESDIVAVRQRAHRVAELVGCDSQDQTRLAAAASEIARNAYTHGGRSGKAEFFIETSGTVIPTLIVRITDRGKGIADPQGMLDGRPASAPGRGHGLVAARRLVDRFTLESNVGQGTTVELGKTTSATLDLNTQAREQIAAILAREN